MSEVFDITILNYFLLLILSNEYFRLENTRSLLCNMVTVKKLYSISETCLPSSIAGLFLKISANKINFIYSEIAENFLQCVPYKQHKMGILGYVCFKPSFNST